MLLDALFDDLLPRGLGAATEFVYSGCSAGALTAYIHLDYVASRVSATTVGIGDAMFSLDHAPFDGAMGSNYYARQFTWGFRAWNATVNQRCLQHYGAENGWKCFHGAIAAQFLQHPILVVCVASATAAAR